MKKFKCPTCASAITVTLEQMGRQINCPSCGAKLKAPAVPAAKPISPPAAIPVSPRSTPTKPPPVPATPAPVVESSPSSLFAPPPVRSSIQAPLPPSVPPIGPPGTKPSSESAFFPVDTRTYLVTFHTKWTSKNKSTFRQNLSSQKDERFGTMKFTGDGLFLEELPDVGPSNTVKGALSGNIEAAFIGAAMDLAGGRKKPTTTRTISYEGTQAVFYIRERTLVVKRGAKTTTHIKLEKWPRLYPDGSDAGWFEIDEMIPIFQSGFEHRLTVEKTMRGKK